MLIDLALSNLRKVQIMITTYLPPYLGSQVSSKDSIKLICLYEM